jgi:hypothetical protein
MRKDCADASAVEGWVALLGYAEWCGRGVAAVERAAKRPAATGSNGRGLRGWVEDKVCSMLLVKR